MVVHAAFGGSTNLLLHVPAIAHAAGLRRPTVDDWTDVNRRVPRIVDVLPNGPRYHPTVRVFMAGGVPEVMLHLRRLGLLELGCLTASGETLGRALDWWENSDRRRVLRERLRAQDGVDPDDVIMSPEQARARGLTSTITFPRGNLAPEGSVIKSTAIDPTVVDADGVYRKTGPARVFTTERAAIAAIKSTGAERVKPGDVLVLICRGPIGAGMEEIYQITAALKHLSFGKHVAVLTDARFSGVSTGACIGHVGPEALAGGPIGKVSKATGSGSWSTATGSRARSTWSATATANAAPRRAPAYWPAGHRGPTSRPIPTSRRTPGSGPPSRRSAAARGAGACTTSTRSPRCSGAERAERPAAGRDLPPLRAHRALGEQLAGDQARGPGARPLDVPDDLPPGRRRRPPGAGARGRTQPPDAARERGPLVLAALFNITAWHLCSAYGLTRIQAGRGAIIAYTMPLWTVIFGRLLIGERIGQRRLAALALGLAGMAVLMAPDARALWAAPSGTLLMLTAAVAWAIGTVLTKATRWTMPTAALTGGRSFSAESRSRSEPCSAPRSGTTSRRGSPRCQSPRSWAPPTPRSWA